MRLTRLNEVMKAKGMRPESLAAMSGLSISTIRNARRKKVVSNSTWFSIALHLKVKKEDLA
jgi:transcriptional regulator with XRE-family HTH domain